MPDEPTLDPAPSYIASLMAARKLAATDLHISSNANAPAAEFCGSGVNPFRDHWLDTINTDEALSSDGRHVASILGEAVGIGRVALTNWQRVNVALGRERMDNQVFVSIRELQAAGYLGRYQGNRYNHSRGWSLSLPEREL